MNVSKTLGTGRNRQREVEVLLWIDRPEGYLQRSYHVPNNSNRNEYSEAVKDIYERFLGGERATSGMVHFLKEPTLFDRLMQEIHYAKTATFKRQSLYEVHGRITMARELKAISLDEYLKLASACVRDGINNPDYFD
jgi:hypothetical protein